MTPARDDQESGRAPRRTRPGRAPNPPAKPSREPRSFEYPIGIEMIEGENYRQREGYDVVYLKDDESPRYQYTIAAGAGRTAEVFRRLAELLPAELRVVLEVPGEVPGPEDGDRGGCEVWVSRPVARDALVGAFGSHERLFIHDGMVGFGAVSADGTTELFLDEHKLIYFYAPDMEGADTALAGLGFPALTIVRHFSELCHVHVSISSRGEGEPYWEAVDELRRTLGLEWEETKEYT